MSTCIVLANAAHWQMLIILHSNYLTIIAISLMIILFFPFVVVQSFQWCRLYGLDHLFTTRVFPKHIPKGALSSLSIIPLAHQDILHTFKQKDVKEDAAALLLTPQHAMLWSRLWKPLRRPSANPSSHLVQQHSWLRQDSRKQRPCCCPARVRLTQ